MGGAVIIWELQKLFWGVQKLFLEVGKLFWHNFLTCQNNFYHCKVLHLPGWFPREKRDQPTRGPERPFRSLDFCVSIYINFHLLQLFMRF